MSARGSLGLAGLALSVFGCSLGVPPIDPFVRHPFEDFPGQTVTGVVSVRGTCAGIEQASGEWFALVWPENAQQVEGQGAPTLRIAGKLVSVGAHARLGGGWAEGGSAYVDYLRDARVTDRCPSSRYFMVSEVVSEPER